eukprot:3298094-Pleurochrysis_carterae.AAC.2
MSNTSSALLSAPKPSRPITLCFSLEIGGSNAILPDFSTPSGTVHTTRSATKDVSPLSVRTLTRTAPSAVCVTAFTTWQKRRSSPGVSLPSRLLYPSGSSWWVPGKSYESSASHHRLESSARLVPFAYSRFAQCHWSSASVCESGVSSSSASSVNLASHSSLAAAVSTAPPPPPPPPPPALSAGRPPCRVGAAACLGAALAQRDLMSEAGSWILSLVLHCGHIEEKKSLPSAIIAVVIVIRSLAPHRKQLVRSFCDAQAATVTSFTRSCVPAGRFAGGPPGGPPGGVPGGPPGGLPSGLFSGPFASADDALSRFDSCKQEFCTNFPFGTSDACMDDVDIAAKEPVAAVDDADDVDDVAAFAA